MKNVIDKARYFLRRRKFYDAVSVLNSRKEIYAESFDFFYTMGLAFLYAGDTGSASVSFGRAREIKINDTNLLLAQAAIFLRRGQTERAVDYYLEILAFEPGNKRARRALQFVRENGDYEKICRAIDSGKIEICYPPLGTNFVGLRIFLIAAGVLALFAVAVFFWPKDNFPAYGRADISSLALLESEIAFLEGADSKLVSQNDSKLQKSKKIESEKNSDDFLWENWILKKNAGEPFVKKEILPEKKEKLKKNDKDDFENLDFEDENPVKTESVSHNYILSAQEIKKIYNKAARYFQKSRDNAAQKELNLILNSNASNAVKQKCRTMAVYFSEPSFDTFKDNYSYAQVAAQTELYENCYVDWSGRISNVYESENSFFCKLYVGYEDMKNVQGIVRVQFDFVPVPKIDRSLPVRILAKICKDEEGFFLQGKSIYQSVKNAYGKLEIKN